MVTKEQILAAQEEWGAGVVKIGFLKDSRSECEESVSYTHLTLPTSPKV